MEGTIAAEIPLALAGARDKKWLEVDPGNVWIKVLWTNADSGAWAVLYRWSKGYVAPPHRHLSDAHMLVLSGALKVRDGCFGPGDYGYEPKGAVHGSTTTLEDCVYLFICNGPILMTEDEEATIPSYEFGCEQVRMIGEQAAAQSH
jgi:anti-sigma factor ChrR (cupin superfamily)